MSEVEEKTAAVGGRRTAQAQMRRLVRLLREPLLHFVLLGLALFAIDSYLRHGGSVAESSKQIMLTLDDLFQIDAYFRYEWHRQPSEAEFAAMVEDKIREEVLYREGLAMRLDKDDTIVKRRMAQKVQFLAEDVAAAHEPTTAELKAWYEKNKEQFALPPRVSFRHLYFSPDSRGSRAHDDAVNALAKLAGQPQESDLANSLGDAFMFQSYYRDRAPDYLRKQFGPQFAQAVTRLAPGSWQGPIESGYGWHLVFVDTVSPGRSPPFEEIEQDVKTGWLAEQKAEAWDKAYKQMRAKYVVLLPAIPSDVRSQGAAHVKTPKPMDIPTSSGEGGL
jgi:hypothetical protein